MFPYGPLWVPCVPYGCHMGPRVPMRVPYVPIRVPLVLFSTICVPYVSHMVPYGSHTVPFIHLGPHLGPNLFIWSHGTHIYLCWPPWAPSTYLFVGAPTIYLIISASGPCELFFAGLIWAYIARALFGVLLGPFGPIWPQLGTLVIIYLFGPWVPITYLF